MVTQPKPFVFPTIGIFALASILTISIYTDTQLKNETQQLTQQLKQQTTQTNIKKEQLIRTKTITDQIEETYKNNQKKLNSTEGFLP